MGGSLGMRQGRIYDRLHKAGPGGLFDGHQARIRGERNDMGVSLAMTDW